MLHGAVGTSWSRRNDARKVCRISARRGAVRRHSSSSSRREVDAPHALPRWSTSLASGRRPLAHELRRGGPRRARLAASRQSPAASSYGAPWHGVPSACAEPTSQSPLHLVSMCCVGRALTRARAAPCGPAPSAARHASGTCRQRSVSGHLPARPAGTPRHVQALRAPAARRTMGMSSRARRGCGCTASRERPFRSPGWSAWARGLRTRATASGRQWERPSPASRRAVLTARQSAAPLCSGRARP